MAFGRLCLQYRLADVNSHVGLSYRSHSEGGEKKFPGKLWESYSYGLIRV